MKIKRLLSQILANRKNRLLYIVDASWEIFILLFPVWFILSNGKARLAETLGGNRDLASILICLTQLIMIYAEKVITYIRIPLIIVPNPATSSPPTRISRKSAIQAHCLHAK